MEGNIMFKKVSESIQKQLDNSKTDVIKLHGTVTEAIHVRRSVKFIGKAVLEAPILIEGGLQVIFEQSLLTVNDWNGQIGVTDNYTGQLTLHDVKIGYSAKLTKEYTTYANKGTEIGALIVSNAANSFITIVDSDILTASLTAGTLKISNSHVGYLFGPASGFYGNVVDIVDSNISNFDLTGDISILNVETSGDLRFFNLTSPAQIQSIRVSPITLNPKTGQMYRIQKEMMAVYKIANRIDDDADIVVNVMTINGEAVVSNVILEEGTDQLLDKFGYGLALINQIAGDVSLTGIDNVRALEFVSVTAGDLKLVGNTNEQIESVGKGKISQVGGLDDPALDDETHQKSALAELNSMIGLASVKTQVKKIIASATMRKQRHQPMSSLHMIFSGNAGTGKTSVANTVADALFENGVIERSKVVHATKKDLVAGYIGQTAEKARQVVEQAYGGVLFIDEAYTLTADSSSNGFEAEAIGELIAQMENHRDNLIVIMAGYTDEMKRFVDSNQGLNSRFKIWIEFPDYNELELTKIAVKLLSDGGMDVTKSHARWMYNAMKYFVSHQLNDGNGRFARNFVDSIIENHDTRLFDGDTEQMITKDDFNKAVKSIVVRSQI